MTNSEYNSRNSLLILIFTRYLSVCISEAILVSMVLQLPQGYFYYYVFAHVMNRDNAPFI
jgi:hypothetical protein